MLHEQAPPGSDRNPDTQGTLVILSGGPGVMFNRSIISPPRVVASQPVQGGEEPRDIVMAVRPSRLDSQIATAEVTASPRPMVEAVREPNPTPLLSHWL